jgi:hypothetical protein
MPLFGDTESFPFTGGEFMVTMTWAYAVNAEVAAAAADREEGVLSIFTAEVGVEDE